MELIDMPGVVYCQFDKGENIISQGEKVNYIYYLISGTCYRNSITEKGDEIIYGIKESSGFVHSLIGVLILYGTGVSNSQFTARTKCSCYKIPRETFFKFVADKPEILNQLIYLAMDEYRKIYLAFQARQEGKVSNKLCDLLLNNSKHQEGKLMVNKTFSNNAEISRFLGVHKVTVAKILKYLKENKVILKSREGIEILDENEMQRYAKAEKSIKY